MRYEDAQSLWIVAQKCVDDKGVYCFLESGSVRIEELMGLTPTLVIIAAHYTLRNSVFINTFWVTYYQNTIPLFKEKSNYFTLVFRM